MATLTMPSTKRLMIDKANARTVLFVSIAAFILIFSAVATKTLLSQAAYQNKVIGKKKEAVSQLRADISATNNLKTSYDAFVGTNQNVLGGNPGLQGQNDGDNAKIILDALPSGYDFPGLTTSLETLLSQQNVTINSISGTDDQVAQSSNQTSTSPQAVPIPFTTAVTGNYGEIQNTISALERSIRPIQIQTLALSGNQAELTLKIDAQTFYQPAKSLNITKEVVK